ncbi:MAG: hypothetical protein OYH77_02780 [Pseudomonadota bacterium]|nr:hypothetical protein [Pseudomonadota bacterium]
MNVDADTRMVGSMSLRHLAAMVYLAVVGALIVSVGSADVAAAASSLCKKYEGAYIAYYDGLYQVRGCKRYDKSASAYQITRSGVSVQQVDADVIRQIPLATKSGSKPVSRAVVCKKLEGKYISVAFSNVYYVKGCQRRVFPNWETYQEHRQRRAVTADTLITPVSSAEMRILPMGEPMPSTAMIIRKQVSKASMDQRCKELENKYVSFYRHIYQIKNCKRNPVQYRDFKQTGATITRELTAEEWQVFAP